MKLIKMLPDKVQIKSNDEYFAKCKLNDLIRITDGDVELVTMVSSLTDTDTDIPLADDELFASIGISCVKNIECNIIGSIVNGRFKNVIDRYPTTAVSATTITNEEFEGMLQDNKESGFIIGNYANYDCNAFVDGNRFYQRHSCIVGNTGCGKSETVAKIIESTVKETNCNIVVFDVHGEYSELSYVDSIKIGKDFAFPAWMVGFSDLTTNVFKVKEETATTVMSALRKAYYTLCPDGNENKPCYFDFEKMLLYIKSLNLQMVGTGEFYKTGDKAGMEKTVKGEFNGKLSGILNTMESLYSDKRYGFLFEKKEQNYLTDFVNRVMGGNKKVKNIDLSGVPHDVAIMIIGAITRLIYGVQLMQDKNYAPITLVCDEAHVYIPVDYHLSPSQKRMVEIFENIAKEGRKFGVTLFVASQRPSELNRTIMAQCANYIVMKLNNENDKTMIKGIMPEGSSGVIETATMFSPGDALVIGDCIPIPLKIHVELAEERPISKTINFWDEWRKEKMEKDYSNHVFEYLKN